MDLLKKAALAYDKMLDIEYLFVTGKNGQLQSNVLHFTANEFKHTIGLHKLTDIPLVCRSSSSNLLFSIKNDQLTLNDISQSIYYPQIEDRIRNFVHLEDYLDNAVLYYNWEMKKSPYSSIEADIMIPSKSIINSNQSTYIFFKNSDNKTFTLSDCIVEKANSQKPISLITDKRDYTRGQVRPPVLLYKEKIEISTGIKKIMINKLPVKQDLKMQQSNKNQPMQMSITEDKPMQVDFSMQGGAAAMTLNPQMPNNEFFTRIANTIAKGVDSLLHKKSDTKRTQVEASDRQQPTPQQSENKATTPTKATVPQPVPQKQSLKAMMSKAAQQKKDMAVATKSMEKWADDVQDIQQSRKNNIHR